MKRVAAVCVLCLVSSMFLSALTFPAVSAQTEGWGTPELLEHDYMGDAEYPQVAIDPMGNAVAVWQQHDGSVYNIRAGHYVIGVGWTSPVLVETNDTGDAELPQVDVDSSGNAMAVWMHYDGTRYNIWASRYMVGTGWGTLELLETNDTGGAWYPQVAVDPSGNAMTVWQHWDGVRYNIWANRYVAGTGWGTPELPETNDSNADSPQVAVDSLGNAVAVWEQSMGSRNDIWANRYVVGTGWGTRELIETNDTGSAAPPQVAVDAIGNAVAVWHQWDGARSSIFANRYEVGVGWGTAELIETNDASDALSPQVAVDPSGNATVVWTQLDGAWQSIWANRYIAGTGWGTAELIETNVYNARDPQVAVDVTGNATAVWTQVDGVYDSSWSNRYVVGTGWGTAEPAETQDVSNVRFSQVAVDPSGNAVAVWEQEDPSYYNIWVNRYAVGVGWGTAELLEQDFGYAELPKVAVDPSGNAIAVWSQDDGANYRTTASRYVEGSGWTVPSVISMSSPFGDWDHQVAIDSNGNAMAVWTQGESPHDNIRSNRYVVGVGWGTAELVETNDTTDFASPQVAMDAAGNAIAVWQSRGVMPYNILANRYVVGTGWGTAELIEMDDTGNAEYPQVAVDPSGNATAVWHQFDGARNNIWSNRYDVGTGWGTAELVETDDTGYANDPRVAVDPSGNAVAVWSQWDGAGNSIYANRYVVGTGWGTPELIETGAGTAYMAEVAVDPSGNAVAVWYQEEVLQSIWSNRYVVGVGWGTAELMATAGTTGSPHVAVDPDGNAVAVWYETQGSRDDLWSNWYEAGKGWGTPVLVETDDVGSVWYPQVGMDASGNAIAVWSQTGVSHEDIWANKFTAPDTIPPVADAGPDQFVTAGDLVTFDGSASTDNEGIVSYGWTFDDGGNRTLWGVSPAYLFYNVGVFDVVLIVEDARGNSDTDSVTITVNPAPDTERPVADAGPDQSVAAGTLVTFDGSGSTDNVGVTNYTWTFDDGGAQTLYDVSPTYTFGNTGVFVVTLTVRDAAMNADADDVVVTVTPPTDTQAPVADAGPDRAIVAGTTIVLDGSASTDNVGVANYTWSFDDGGMQYRYAVMWEYQFSNVATIPITLVVRDAAGLSDTDTVTITVNPSGADLERPVADAGPDQSVAAGTLVTFDGSGSTDNVGVTNYTWTFDDGGARTLYGVSPTYPFNAAGTFVVTLTVRDAAMNADADDVVVTVTPPTDTQAPVADAGPDRAIVAGTTIVLDGSASTDNVGIVNYTWSFDDGGMRYRYAMMFAYQFSNVGVITITLTVRDAAGNTDTDDVVITVNPVTGDLERPVADAGPDQSVAAGTLVTFDGSGSTDNVGVTNHTWTFDDGGAKTLYEASPTYTFGNVGVFVVTLTVRDAAGNTDADDVVITVTPPTDTQAPVADAGDDQSVYTDVTVVLDGSGSTDNVGIVNYTWTFTYDGATRTLYGPMASFRFAVAGPYTITLTVRDAAGNSDTDTVAVTSTVRPGGGTTEREVVPSWAFAAIALFAILTVVFLLLFLLSRRKRGAVPVEEETEPEEELPSEEETAEEEREA